MRRVQFYYDEPRELSEEDYLFLIERLGGSMYSGALMLIGELLQGIPNVQEIATSEMFEDYKALIRGINEITDQELRSSVQLLADHSSQLWELEFELLEIVARFYGFEAPYSNSDRKRLHKKLNQHWVRPPALDWRGSEQYQEMVKMVEHIQPFIPMIKKQIDERLRELQAQLRTNV